MKELLLGIDAGNTVVKAVLFDRAGRAVGKAALDGKSSQPQPGYVERDIAELWRNAAEVIGLALRDAGAKGEDVAVVGTAGHGNGLYLLDKQDQPLIGIQSLDIRAAKLAEELSAGDAGDRAFSLCLQKPWPSQTATLLAWVKCFRPDLYERAGTAMLCKDTLTLSLTGKRVSDYSDMSGSGLLRLPERRYDPALLALYGLEDARALLPPLVQSDAIAGRITAEAARSTGLAEGTPVAGGLFDIVSSAIGAGAGAPGRASIVVGTWSINQVVLERPLVDPSIFMASTWRPDRYVAAENSATSAVNLEWFAREMLGGHGAEVFGRCNALAGAAQTTADSPMFHPFLFGSSNDPAARGAFFGLTGWHSNADVVRALYEGVIFEHRRHVDRLIAAGASFDAAALSGGGARSEVWCQMFADGLGVPMTVSDCEETGALGAAIAAAVATGLFADIEAGIAGMVRAKRHFLPAQANEALQEARYRLYCNLAEAVPAHWKAYRANLS